MNYHNVEKGIKKIYISQIFAIVVAVMSGGTVLLTEILSRLFDESSTFLAMAAILTVAFFLVFLVVVIGTGLLEIFGYYQALKDEPMFKKAMICALVSSSLTVLGVFVQIPNGMLYTIFTSASTILEMFVMVYAIAGLIGISENCARPDLCKKGDMLLKIMVVTYIISSIEALITRIFELSDHAKIVSLIIGAADLILMVLRYVFYLRYLRDEMKMLRNVNANGVRG